MTRLKKQYKLQTGNSNWEQSKRLYMTEVKKTEEKKRPFMWNEVLSETEAIKLKKVFKSDCGGSFGTMPSAILKEYWTGNRVSTDEHQLKRLIKIKVLESTRNWFEPP